MTVVAISSLAGGGGALIAPEVARRLSLPFLDRAIPMETARRLSMDEKAVLEQEEHPEHGFARIVHLLAPASGIYSAPLPEMDESDITAHMVTYRAEEVRVVREHADHGAVILGRGAAVILADHPRALRVSLVGPVEDRITQLARLSGIDLDQARKQQYEADHLRRSFIHRLLRADPFDPKYYQLVIDSTKLPFATCVSIIVETVRSLEEHWALES
ncbi:MAG: cytidylate kinase-like family protein [Actinomycetota bacterium]|nr:cytidylate kinase-like family protein [Actinomycetota bacterium]